MPDVGSIYEAAFENTGPFAGEKIEDCKAALGITFSRYPVSLTPVLRNPSDDGLPLIEFEAETQEGYSETVVAEALEAGHIILGDTWYPLSLGDVSELRDFMASIGGVDNGRVTSFRSLLALKQNSCSENALIRDETDHDAISALQYVPKSEGSPRGIDATLYPYQLEGWNWLRFLIGQGVGALLADEMGLGKTLQVISAIVDPDDTGPLFPTLIVAPGSLLENWRREFEKFAPGVKVVKHQGAFRTGRPKELEEYDVVITSYDTVNRDLSLLKMITWKVVVSDESQNIKNPDALRSKSIKQIPRDVSLAMTGTPVENRLDDLWSVMDFAVPGYLGTLEDFRSRFQDDVDGATHLEPLVSPLMLRRLVENVAQDLPERIDIPQVLEMSDAEAAEYERIRHEIAEEYGKAATLVSLTSLRQFCAHPVLLSARDSGNLSSEFTKIERLKEILEEIFFRQEKVIVFTSYTEMADLITKIIKSEYGVFAETLDGRIAIEDRQPLIDRFSAVQGAATLVLNPRAAGAGLNITAANHVIHYNLEWNPATEDQASARAYRRGQTRPVTVHRLFYADTVEETVNERIQRKRTLSEAAVVGVQGKEDDFEDIIAALGRSPMKGRHA